MTDQKSAQHQQKPEEMATISRKTMVAPKETRSQVKD